MSFDLNTIFAGVIAAAEQRINEIVSAALDAHSALQHDYSVVIQAHEERLQALEATDLGLNYTAQAALTERVAKLEEARPGAAEESLTERIDSLESQLATDNFEQAVVDAIDSRAQDVVSNLSGADCSELMGDSVSEEVAKAIENGEFSIEFNSGRRRRY